jgi:heme/copper-type cytochrome/quinol oxidase subunit 3
MTSIELEAKVDGREAAELVPRNVAVAARLAAAATTFAFMGPFFAYFYLRSLNTDHMWKPLGVHAPQAWGAVIMVLYVASALALAAAPHTSRWGTLGISSLALGIAAVVVQCVEYTHLGFGPMSGGYASVFVAWTGLTAAFVLGTLLSLEMVVAYVLRNRGAPPEIVLPRLHSLSFYWSFLAGLSVVMWVVLYLL